MIEVEDLNVAFGRGRDAVHAVRQVSFRVAEGESFGLVGESGSGKSTVLRALCGLNPHWSGRITVDGKPLAPKRDKAFFKLAQMVFQDPYGSLHPRHTVDRILSEPVAIHGMSEPDRRISQALEEVGLADRIDHFPSQLSGGEQQRVAIARALAKQPPILLCDEPTGELDFETGRMILALLRRLNRENGQTVLLVTHNAAVGEMADRVVRLRSGKVVEDRMVANPVAAEDLTW